MKKIILSGYMGCGKSTVGELLGKKTGLLWLDLDKLIEEKTHLSIPDIFEKMGEIYFRKTEHLMLTELVTSTESFVLSLGGGTPCYSNNIHLLNRSDLNTVYLKASIEFLIERVRSEWKTRPFLSNLNDDDLREFIGKHLFERMSYYAQAKYCINTDNKTPEEITNEIMLLI